MQTTFNATFFCCNVLKGFQLPSKTCNTLLQWYSEFPLVLKSGGPGTSSSMKLGDWSFLLFKGPLTTIGVSFFFSEFLCLFSKRLSYVVCSHNYIFSRLTKLDLLYKTHLSNFYFYILVILSLCFGYFPVGWFDSMSISIRTFVE